MLSEKTRDEIALRYFQAAQAINKKAALADVSRVNALLVSACSSMHPKTDGSHEFFWGQPIRPLGSVITATHYPPCWVYVYDPGDRQYLHPDCIRNLGLDDPRQGACFHPDHRIFVLDAQAELSDFLAGLRLVHEGYHALVSPTIKDHVREHDRHEYQTWRFQHRCVTALGGEAYAAVLRERIDSLKVEIAGRNLLDIPMFQNVPYFTSLNTFMDLPANRREELERNYCLLRHALFSILEESGMPVEEQIRQLKPIL
ncbi:MAG: hypothetical protein HYZ63_02630 [Candidatus Andersenbacteria bacterium]|nr:hypothetical protein [Candidatus Andersenbacteria bacterium]